MMEIPWISGIISYYRIPLYLIAAGGNVKSRLDGVPAPGGSGIMTLKIVESGCTCYHSVWLK